MIENNEMTLKKKQRNKRKTRKIALLFFLTGVTAILLIVETYAWFVGTSTVTTSSFSIGVSSGDAFKMSLDGKTWVEELTITKDAVLGTGSVEHKAYENHNNVWPDDETGLIPLSTAGEADPTNGGRLKLFGKSSLTATGGGYRLISTQIDNHSDDGEGHKVSGKGYVAFDLFIQNGTGVDYLKTYNRADDEAIYLMRNSSVSVDMAGQTPPTDDYGLANSVRVAFVQIGRVASASSTVTEGDIRSITCTTTDTEESKSTSLCTKDGNVTIWEPNENKHHTQLVSYFNKVCKKKTAAVEGGSFTYGSGEEGACTALTATSHVSTYVVKNNITSADNVDIYDGLNGYTPTTTPAENVKLIESKTFTDADRDLEGANRPAFFYLAPNSVTKVRVYIYLEGQDVDNYDLASNGKKIKVNFGFTKDQWDLTGTDAVES